MREARAAIVEQVVDGLSSGVIAVDLAGKVVTANTAARLHLELDENALKPGTPLDAAEGTDGLLDALDEVRRSGAPVRRREVVLDTPRGPKTLGMNVSPLAVNGVNAGHIMLFADLTEVKRLEHAAEVNRQLAQIGELTAGVVHELRNPLSVVSGMAELMLRKIKEDTDLRRNAEAILNEAAQMGKLITQFLGFARPYVIQAGDVELRRIADRCHVLCVELAKARGVRLSFDPNETEVTCHVDADAVVQAVGNILRNAIEVTEPGGLVCLSASHNGEMIEFCVTDQGPGINLAPGEDLFSPFFSKREGGTGLGLSIAQRAVLAQQGAIVYENLPRGGTRFKVTLPVRVETPATATPEDASL